ncbi:hypothetical protein B9Z65_2787 [Elsinoe australis]|uniref:Uncharacterized protein n=1 Tax=Elsinoe australis TaxID=40998 RepID=A0A2P8A4P0_9PEZI|nr:hypothetical protein B9Z65_2787 [Elsinoe australis]
MKLTPALLALTLLGLTTAAPTPGRFGSFGRSSRTSTPDVTPNTRSRSGTPDPATARPPPNADGTPSAPKIPPPGSSPGQAAPGQPAPPPLPGQEQRDQAQQVAEQRRGGGASDYLNAGTQVATTGMMMAPMYQQQQMAQQQQGQGQHPQGQGQGGQQAYPAAQGAY